MSERPVLLLKRILLGFWAAWLTVVLATNAADAAKALGLLGEGWALASGNYRLVAEATSRYGMPAWVNGLLFLGVLLWQGVAAVLFGLACWRFRGRAVASSRPPLYAAFTAGLTLGGVFS